MSKFFFEKVDDLEKWDSFVMKSPQGTLFSHSSYIQAVGKPFEMYFIFKGEEQKAGLTLILSDDRAGCVLDDLVIYNGILFNYDSTKKTVKSRLERFEITEFIIEELDKRYSFIEMALAPQFEDLRPFLWHNYHSPSPEKMFAVDLRYTSYLDISELEISEDDKSTNLFRDLDTLRQRNIREAQKKNGDVVLGENTELFLDFYSKTLQAQDQSVNVEKIERMRKLIKSLINNDNAFTYSSKKSDGEVGYISIFCKDDKRAYYLFGAGHPQLTERYLGTFAFWEAFRDLAKNHSITEVDMEGVNSPNRGKFKLSFGGGLTSYYHVYKPQSRLSLYR
jgi:hypothetical protein